MKLYVRYSDSPVNKRRVWKHRQASPAEILSAARQAVESGTIEGQFRQWHGPISLHPKGRPELGDDLPAGTYLVVPVAALGADE